MNEPPDFRRARRQRPELAGQLAQRLPPHSPEAEQGVLGCVLLSPHDSMGICVERLGTTTEVFYNLRHQTIYAAMVEQYEKREAIDVVTLQQHLKDKQLLEQVGGLPYLSSLQDTVPSASNITYYLDIVAEKFLLRSMIAACTNTVSKIYDYEGDVDALMDETEADVLRVAHRRFSQKSKEIKTLVGAAITTIETLHQNQGKISGVPTGLADLDKITRGLQNGDMIVIGARPSLGKTSLAMTIAEHAAVNCSIPVGVFSLEMTAESLVLRMLCSLSRVSLTSVNEGFLAERDFVKLTGAAGKLSKAPIYIDDTSGYSVAQLRAKARRMFQQYGIKVFVIDYLQLLHGTSKRAENRQQEVTEISSGIKELAKELNVPVIALSQLNRELERDKGRKPRLADIKDSGSIEADGDLVALLYKAKTPDDEPDQREPIDSVAEAVNLLIAKQRNGATGDIPLTFLKSYTRFESAAKITAEDTNYQQPYAD